MLDERARNKYPLGFYVYGGKENRIHFECSRLVNTDCETDEDIEIGEFIENNVKLLVLKSQNLDRVLIGILIRWDGDDDISNFEIIKKFCTKGDKLDRIFDLGIELKNNGQDRIEEKTKRGFLR